MCICAHVYTCVREHQQVVGCRRSSLSLARDPSLGCTCCVGEGGEAGKGLTQGSLAVTSPNGKQTVLQQLPSVRQLTGPRLCCCSHRVGPASLLSFTFGNKQEEPRLERDSLFLPQIAWKPTPLP